MRGFSEEESNIFSDGSEIDVVRNEAYLFSLKIEPRYYINDNMAASFFVDLGRVSKKHPNFKDLRSSVGLSYKILTPVGSLDFNYGVKLKRKRFEGGQRESFGRAHISIGQF